MDPRLQGRNAELIAQAVGFEPGEFEQLCYPGPSLWVTEPHQADDHSQFWWIFKNVSDLVHHVKSVVIVGHSQCGGFQLKAGAMTPEAEREMIITSLRTAGTKIKQAHPAMAVQLVFVTIGAATHGLPELTCEVI